MPRTAAALIALSCMSVPAAAQPLTAEDAQALRDEIGALRARLEALESRLATAPPPRPAAPPQLPPSVEIEWRGSPRFVSGDRRFKAKGRFQTDAGYVSRPPGSTDRAFGFSNEIRRVRLGGEGDLGGGFGYKLELELSDNAVDLVDSFVTFESGPWLLTAGNFNQYQSLDELIGDTSGSFLERAAFTDAFNFERRLGIGVQRRIGDWLLQAGAFTDDASALASSSDGAAGGDENNSFGIDGRIVRAFRIEEVTVHLGASAHWRALKRTADAGTRYRQRPYLHSVNTRVLATATLPVREELHYGGELAVLAGRWHFAGEVHWLRAALPAAADPAFFGGYTEIGWYLTDGDSRTYRNGIFERGAPKAPLGSGGFGSVQLNLRYDHLDLDTAAVDAGKQHGVIAALIWSPVNYLRLNINYAHLEYRFRAAEDFGLDVIGTRMELDF